MTSAKGKHPATRWLVSGIVAVAIVGGIFAATHNASSGPASQDSRSPSVHGPTSPSALDATTGHCAAASAAAIASVDTRVARRIYTGEIRGNVVSADVAHVTGERELLSALASSNGPAVYAAVHAIVYTPHWHIVRLRVVKNGHVLADVGGPYIIAPVKGKLRWKGRTVGSFVMSVQDDIGYVKLVTRFIGVPIDLYRGGAFLMGTLRPAPGSVRDGQSVTVAGRPYQTHVLNTLAFPSGTMQAALFVAKPTSTLSARSCAAVKVAAWGGVAKHIAARFSPLATHYRDFVGTLQGSTAGLVYVRAGSRVLAGASGPTKLPRGGTVTYRGRSWAVFSWEPVPPARIYFLTPPG